MSFRKKQKLQLNAPLSAIDRMSEPLHPFAFVADLSFFVSG